MTFLLLVSLSLFALVYKAAGGVQKFKNLFPNLKSFSLLPTVALEPTAALQMVNQEMGSFVLSHSLALIFLFSFFLHLKHEIIGLCSLS